MGAYSPDAGSICAYCGSPAAVFDHVIPRSRGGWGGSNLVPACRACNTSKRDLDVAVWLGGQVVASQDARRKRISMRLARGDIAFGVNDPGLETRVCRDVFRRIAGMADRVSMSRLAGARIGPAWDPFAAAIAIVEHLVGAGDEEEAA